MTALQEAAAVRVGALVKTLRTRPDKTTVASGRSLARSVDLAGGRRRGRRPGALAGSAERHNVVHPHLRPVDLDLLHEQLDDCPAILPGAAFEPTAQALLELPEFVDHVPLDLRLLVLLFCLRAPRLA